LLDTAVLPSCFAEVVSHIFASNFARLELLVFNGDAQRNSSQGRAAKSLLGKVTNTLRDKERRERLLYTLYERLDQRRFAVPNDPLAPVDCSEPFRNIESITVTPITKRFVHRFPVEAIEQVRKAQLDVLIRFGFNILRGEILTLPKYGIWSYHHGDNDYYRGGPAYFWEVYERNPLSGAILQVLTEHLDAGMVLCKGQFATSNDFSASLNRVQPYWGAVTFIIQKLHELHERGWEHIERSALEPAPYLGKKKIYTRPTNREMLRRFGPALIGKSVRKVARRPRVKHWRLAIRTGAESILDNSAKPDLAGFRWMESPKGRFYADPFLIESEGKSWLFFEDFDYGANRGRISCTQIQDGAMTTPLAVLERPYHLSYPCVFRDGGEFYMIPETAQSGAVELYRCGRFPDVWELDTTLLKLRAVDSTLWAEDGQYWLFVTMQEPRGGATQLWLFQASSLRGPWRPHPASPISTDVRKSRGAGAVFRAHGKLFRPSQDCSRHYGSSFTLNEIATLNPREYREEEVLTVGPTWARDLIATHSYSRGRGIEVIDGCVPVAAEEVE